MKRVVVDHYGGPDVLKVVEEEDPRPGRGEVRIKVLAAGVSFTDAQLRAGTYIGVPKPPFTPGYELVGVVEEVGPGCTRLREGDRIGALTVWGADAERVCLPEADAVEVPEDLDPAEVVSLLFPYMTAYQVLHRIAEVKSGERVLVHGAAGRVGTAVLELGAVAGLRLYGTASARDRAAVERLGAEHIDYRNEDFVARLRTTTAWTSSSTGSAARCRCARSACCGPAGGSSCFGRYATMAHGHRDRRAIAEWYGSLALLWLWDKLSPRRRVLAYRIQKLHEHPARRRARRPAALPRLVPGGPRRAARAAARGQDPPGRRGAPAVHRGAPRPRAAGPLGVEGKGRARAVTVTWNGVVRSSRTTSNPATPQHPAQRARRDAPEPVRVAAIGVVRRRDADRLAARRARVGAAVAVVERRIQDGGAARPRQLGQRLGREDQQLAGDRAQPLERLDRVRRVVEHAAAPHDVVRRPRRSSVDGSCRSPCTKATREPRRSCSARNSRRLAHQVDARDLRRARLLGEEADPPVHAPHAADVEPRAARRVLAHEVLAIRPGAGEAAAQAVRGDPEAGGGGVGCGHDGQARRRHGLRPLSADRRPARPAAAVDPGGARRTAVHHRASGLRAVVQADPARARPRRARAARRAAAGGDRAAQARRRHQPRARGAAARARDDGARGLHGVPRPAGARVRLPVAPVPRDRGVGGADVGGVLRLRRAARGPGRRGSRRSPTSTAATSRTPGWPRCTSSPSCCWTSTRRSPAGATTTS